MRTSVRFTIPGLLLAFTLAATAHDGTHWELRHWALASPDPDRIFLTFHGDPATRRAVTWRTDASVERAVAEIAVALGEPGFDQIAKRVEAKTEAIDLSRVPDTTQGEVLYHSAIFENLQPETLYAYRVGDRRWSEWIQFRTASKEPEPFSFVYFGDAQNDVLSRWSRVIRMAHQTAPDAVFALHAGDLINRADADTEWAEWFKAGGYLHAQWTGIPVIGNHEYKTKRVKSMFWRPQFTLPVASSLPKTLHETVYTVDYQGVRIIALNSNEKVSEQVAYLNAQLKNPGYRWCVVTFHHPIFPPGGKSGCKEQDRREWEELFARHKVDFVLQGHDHAYVRGQVPVIEHDGTSGSGFQTLYVTSVSGPKQYKINAEYLKSYASEGYTTQRKAVNTQFFQVIEIDGDRASYKAYTATGALYDAAVIEKNHTTGEKKIIQRIPATDERTYENTVRYSKENL